MAIFMLIVWHNQECISTQCALQLLSNSTHLVWGLGSTAPCASKIMSFAFRAEETMTFWINKRTGNLAQGSGHHRKPKRTGKQKIQEYRYPRSSVWLTTTLHRERQSPLITAKKDIFKSTGDYNFHKFFFFPNWWGNLLATLATSCLTNPRNAWWEPKTGLVDLPFREISVMSDHEGKCFIAEVDYCTLHRKLWTPNHHDIAFKLTAIIGNVLHSRTVKDLEVKY